MTMLMSISSYAQFTIYEPVYAPPSRSTSPSYYDPFTVYQSVPDYDVQYRRAPQPTAKQYTLTGYYKTHEGWFRTQIRVSVSDDVIKLVGVKYGNSWCGCNSTVSEVGAFDTQEVKDNFNYKGYFTNLGMIYF